MILLGLDIGTVRIGVAKSDPLGMIASPFEVISATDKSAVIKRLKDIVADERVDKIIVGLPKRMDGTIAQAAEGVLAWVDCLKANVSIPVLTHDERLSTKAAERALLEGDVSRKKRKQHIDKVAAVVILQGYLDTHRAPASEDPDYA